MRHPFNLDDFESFLSDQTDRHRMYASDRVWRNINKTLHRNDRWPALTFASILTVSIIAVILTLTYPNKQLFEKSTDFNAIALNTKGQVQNQHVLSGLVPPKERKQELSSKEGVVPNELRNNIKGNETGIHNNYEVNGHSGLSLNDLVLEERAQNNIEISETEVFTNSTQTVSSIEDPTTVSHNRIEQGQQAAGNKTVFEKEPPIDINNARLAQLSVQNEDLTTESFVKSSMDYGPVDLKQNSPRKSPWSIQFYATPSVSYRYWLDDQHFEDDPNNTNGPLAPYLTHSVNEFISHKPKMGLEVGGAILYDLANNFRLKTGLQLNYRQFGIAAFETNSPQPALLTLNGANGPDGIIKYTRISNQAGDKPIELTSNYLQLAVPVGFDLNVGKIQNVGFYVSASGQFTYQLTSRNFLISTDYKNYMQEPNLDRRFNINTAVEAFASFEAAGLTWQAGPQIRYQLLPGTKDIYPIREHLIDYGFKIGVVKTLK